MKPIDSEGRIERDPAPVGPDPFQNEQESRRPEVDFTELLTPQIMDKKFATATKGVYEWESHDADGSHVFLVYNEHTSSSADREKNLAPEFIIQKYPPGHQNPRKEEKTEFRWIAGQKINELFDEKQMTEIVKILDLFKNAVEGGSGQT